MSAAQPQILIRRKRRVTEPEFPDLVVETSTKKVRALPTATATVTDTPHHGPSFANASHSFNGSAPTVSANAPALFFKVNDASNQRRYYRKVKTTAIESSDPSAENAAASHDSIAHSSSSPALEVREDSAMERGSAGAAESVDELVIFRTHAKKIVGNAAIIDIELPEDHSSSHITGDHAQRQDAQYVYDFYEVDESVDWREIDIQAFVRVDNPFESNVFLSDDEDSNEADSDDSNAENYYANEYPDEDEVQSWEERSDDDDESGTRSDESSEAEYDSDEENVGYVGGRRIDPRLKKLQQQMMMHTIDSDKEESGDEDDDYHEDIY